MAILDYHPENVEDADTASRLAILSHEFKTPLSVTLATLNLLQKKLSQTPGIYGEDYEKLFGIATRNVYKVLRMAENFVDTGRFACGLAALNIVPTDIISVLRGTVELLNPMLQSRRASVDFETTAPNPFIVDCDPQALDRVLLNLLSNAIKHIPHQNGRIIVSVTKQGPNAVLKVTDNGCGVSQAALPHLFERYWRDESPDSVDKTGTGLGLFIVKSLVELHGGTIDVESKPYMVTSFIVTLPISSKQEKTDQLNRDAAEYETEQQQFLLRKELPDFI